MFETNIFCISRIAHLPNHSFYQHFRCPWGFSVATGNETFDKKELSDWNECDRMYSLKKSLIHFYDPRRLNCTADSALFSLILIDSWNSFVKQSLKLELFPTAKSIKLVRKFCIYFNCHFVSWINHWSIRRVNGNNFEKILKCWKSPKKVSLQSNFSKEKGEKKQRQKRG